MSSDPSPLHTTSHTTAGSSELRRFAAAVVLAGITAGVTGWACAHLLHTVEHFVWSISEGHLVTALETVPWWRRLLTLAAAGVIGAVSWVLLHRTGPGPVSTEQAVAARRMPVLRTIWHAATQIVIIAMGASLGREVAPREAGAALSGWISDRFGLNEEDRRILVACGAGAGLAAVYGIPLSGIFFALEALLATFSKRSLASALAVSGIAVFVSTGWARPEVYYRMPELVSSPALVAWAVLCGPAIGLAGALFGEAVKRAEQKRPTTPRLLWVMPLGFAVVGAVSIWVPWVLGNGHPVTQTVTNQVAEVGPQALGLITLLLLAKAVTTLITVRAGAWGGTLNPGIALGAALGGLTGLVWSLIWPGSNLVACVFIGAAAFLGASIKAPLTGFALVLELTHSGATVLVPTALAIAGATAAASWWRNRGKEHGGNNDDEEPGGNNDDEETGPVALTTGPVEKVN